MEGFVIWEGEIVDGHFAGGEGAGFVESDSVDACEGFDGVEVLDEDFFLAEPDSSEGEDGAREQDEALGNHVDEGGDGASDGDFGGGTLDAEAGPEDEGTDGNEGEADILDDVVHEGEKLGVGGPHFVSGLFDSAQLRFGANGGGGGFTSAGNDERAGDELVAFFLSDVILLTSDESFVDFDGALFEAAVDEDLVAEREDEEVAFDNLVLVDLDGFAVSDDGGLLLGGEAHFVDGAFGADFVDDTNQGVRDGDEDKEEVLVRADGQNHEGEDEVDEVEDGEGVFEDDFWDGASGFLRGAVDFALGDFGLDLFGSKTLWIHRIIVTQCGRGGGLI